MIEEVFIKNSQGLRLAAVLHCPNNDNGKYPAVILLHGFGGYKEEKHIEKLANDLASNGFVAIRFDASGFNESEGAVEKDFRISNYLKDIQVVHDYLKSLSYVDKNRVGIWGHSMGGMLSIIFASNHPEMKAICSVSAPQTIGSSKALKPLMAEWEKTGWLSKESSRLGQIKIPFAFAQDAKNYDVIDYVDKIKVPLMVVIGKKDENVAPEDTKGIYLKASQPKELIEVDDMDHYYKNNPKLIEYVNGKVILFLKKYL